MCLTSPPYWRVRDYGHKSQIGLENLPTYIDQLVSVFREVRRCLADDGVLWLNLASCYTGSANTGGDDAKQDSAVRVVGIPTKVVPELGSKQLVGVPWAVAFALQADKWRLRSEVIWHKPGPMPENLSDRPTRAHEQVFLLSKSEDYFYDWKAIATRAVSGRAPSKIGRSKVQHSESGAPAQSEHVNRRSVWSIVNGGVSVDHAAAMPEELASLCIQSGSRLGDTVLDPFFGTGTTGRVAEALGRNWIGVELNPQYGAMANDLNSQVGLKWRL